MPADQQRRVLVEPDAVDGSEQGDDREGVGDEVGDDADVRRGARERLLLEDLDPDLLDRVQEVAQGPLLGEEHRQQPDLELEVVMVGGDDLDAAWRRVQELAVLVRRRAERLLDQDHVAQVVVARERRQVRGRGRGDVGDHVGAGLQLALELVVRGRAVAVPVEGVAVRAHLLLLHTQAIARAWRVLLDDVGAEVEELLERQQVLVRLLPPLPETDEDEILLQVSLLLGERMQARVLDRHRGLDREGLRPLHLLGLEAADAGPLREHGRADRLVVGDQRQRHQRLHAKRADVLRVDLRAGRRVVDHHRPLAVEDVEEERVLRPLAVLTAPEVLEV